MSLDARVWAVAREVCNADELYVLRKREDLGRRGMLTWVNLAAECGSPVRTVRARVQSAEAKIAKALEEAA